MKKNKKNTKITYSEEALKYFQEMNDNDEFMTEPVSGDYVDYLLGDVGITLTRVRLWILSGTICQMTLIGLWTKSLTQQHTNERVKSIVILYT